MARLDVPGMEEVEGLQQRPSYLQTKQEEAVSKKKTEKFLIQHEIPIQVSRGLLNLYYSLGKRKKTDLSQHARSVESSPSMLDL